jgi:hypothetical protein
MRDNLFFLAIFFLAACLIIPPSQDKEKTLYFFNCSDFEHNIYSCPKDQHIVASKRVFRILLKEQLVIFKDLNSEPKSCVVFDEKNWRCEKESMIGGRYFALDEKHALDEKGEETYLPIVQQMPASAYYIRCVINFFKYFHYYFD